MIHKGDFLIMRVAGTDPCGLLVAIEQLQYIVQRRTVMIRKTLRFHHHQSNRKILTRLQHRKRHLTLEKKKKYHTTSRMDIMAGWIE
jgi:diketogulonate reductase-like aldo/keto reductase